jgi:hypothetical protein
MIEVYHMTDDWTPDQRWQASYSVGADAFVQVMFVAQRYRLVAEVDTADLETAWHLTNNIDSSWSLDWDGRVTVKVPLPVIDGKTYGLKSSEVGDIFVVDRKAVYRCAPIGFSLIHRFGLRRPKATEKR